MNGSVTHLHRAPDPYTLVCRVEALTGALDCVETENADLQRRLALAEQRANRAERWLRSRVVEKVWPAALGGIGGGVALLVLLRIAGL